MGPGQRNKIDAVKNEHMRVGYIEHARNLSNKS
jgi:hypothetical protein